MKRGGVSSGCSSTAATPHTDGKSLAFASASTSEVSEFDEEAALRKAAMSSAESRAEEGLSNSMQESESLEALLLIKGGMSASRAATMGFRVGVAARCGARVMGAPELGVSLSLVSLSLTKAGMSAGAAAVVVAARCGARMMGALELGALLSLVSLSLTKAGMSAGAAAVVGV